MNKTASRPTVTEEPGARPHFRLSVPRMGGTDAIQATETPAAA
jgi:hypothetical protein